MNHCLIMNFPEKFYIVCVAFWENLAFILYIYIFRGWEQPRKSPKLS